MRTTLLASLVTASLVISVSAHAETGSEVDAPAVTPPRTSAERWATDLFPGKKTLTTSVATGLPFLGIGEVGVGVTDGFAIGVVGGITPSVVTAGIRPRFRVRTSQNTALMLSAPMLYYPRASAPGPGNIGSTSWVLTRPELMLDGVVSDRWHVAGGMGIIAAASTVSLGQTLEGNEFRVPAYNGATESKKGFAGGVWNTVCARASFAWSPRTHLFAESSVVLQGIRPAEGVGGVPLVVTTGAQHSF